MASPFEGSRCESLAQWGLDDSIHACGRQASAAATPQEKCGPARELTADSAAQPQAAALDFAFSPPRSTCALPGVPAVLRGDNSAALHVQPGSTTLAQEPVDSSWSQIGTGQGGGLGRLSIVADSNAGALPSPPRLISSAVRTARYQRGESVTPATCVSQQRIVQRQQALLPRFLSRFVPVHPHTGC